MEGEHYLDMATALSGTGPAYIFLFMEALIDVGVHMGFSRHDAQHLVLQTIRGSVEYAAASGLHPAELRNQVTSPGGTTAAALYEMEKGGFRTVVAEGVWAAFQRSVALGGGSQKDD
jgi:pyrroline-5-carboxylate reductase